MVQVELLNIIKTGTIGVDATAKVTLAVNENTPDVFYYKFNSC